MIMVILFILTLEIYLISRFIVVWLSFSKALVVLTKSDATGERKRECDRLGVGNTRVGCLRTLHPTHLLSQALLDWPSQLRHRC